MDITVGVPFEYRDRINPPIHYLPTTDYAGVHRPTQEVMDWLDANIGHYRYSTDLKSERTWSYSMVNRLVVFYFFTQADATLFKLTWL